MFRVAVPYVARARSGLIMLACFATGAAAATDDAQLHGSELMPDVPKTWGFSVLESRSHFSGERSDWNVLDLRLQSRASSTLQIGTFINMQRRPPDTNVGYGVDFSWYPLPVLEWRGAMTLVAGASFLPTQSYSTGLEWRATNLFSVATDYKRQNFSEGPIDQWAPALTLWLADDQVSVTGKYVMGRAFGERDFHAYALRWISEMPNHGRITLAYARGADPEKDFGIPGVILTDATDYVFSYRLPVRPSLNLIIGAEYEDRHRIYTKTTGTVGLDFRF